MKDISIKIFWQLIVLLIIIRIFSVVFLIFGSPAVGCFENYFPSCSGGDEGGYFSVAKSFSEFRAEDHPGFGTIGAALVYVPYIWLTGAEDFTEISKQVFIVQAFLMYILAIIIVSYIGKLVFKNNILGIVTGGIFTIYPYFVYFSNLGPYNEYVTNFRHLMWIQPVLSDAPSAFFIFLGVLLFMMNFENKNNKKKNAIFSGLVCGFASLIRITNILVCAAMGVIYLIRKKYIELALFFIFASGMFSIQLVFNYMNYKDSFHFGQFNQDVVNSLEERMEQKTFAHISYRGFTYNNYFYFLSVADKYIPHLLFIMILVIILTVLNIRYLYFRNRIGAVFIFLWVFIFMVFYCSYAPAARNFRYWLPIVPALIILLINFFAMSIFYFKKMYFYFKKYE